MDISMSEPNLVCRRNRQRDQAEAADTLNLKDGILTVSPCSSISRVCRLLSVRGLLLTALSPGPDNTHRCGAGTGVSVKGQAGVITCSYQHHGETGSRRQCPPTRAWHC
ncbi:hypothetical protein ElyMa_000989400 [Elysia marginata]|uniref:Uncharacterized protein n=1 Tax=Elysia marginata TaxID=1093978 RepID=A0AAV4HJN9_9GAST|nr:hypothetical protein ElyMa_000989400 [Elysia marginata]